MTHLQNTETAGALRAALSERVCGRVPYGAIAETDADRNLYRFLVTETGRRMLRYAETAEYGISDRASDFENFEALLHLLPSLVGSGYHSFVQSALELLLGADHPKDAETLWRASVPLLEKGRLKGMLDPFRSVSLRDVTDLVCPVPERVTAVASLSEYISEYEFLVREADAVLLDVSKLSFRSPDPYHANEGFALLKSGNATEESQAYLASQLVRVTGELCCRYGRPLLLMGEPSERGAGEMLRYLKKNDRLPRIFYRLRLDGARAVEERYRVSERIGLLDEILGVIPTGLPYGSTVTLRESLAASLRCYPLGKHCFLAEGESEAEVRVGYERFAAVLAETLADYTASGACTENEAVTLGERVLIGGELLR